VAEGADRRVAALARRQHGYVTRRQLQALGLGVKAIDYRLGTGRLIRVHAGVYAVGHLPTLAVDRAHGALLACGERAVLSHRSAATAWGMFGEWRMPFEVTSPTSRRRDGITVHRAELRRRDVRVQLGLRVTSPARTVLDIAPRVRDRRLTRIVNDLRLANQLRLSELADVLERNPRHPGARRLRPFLEAERGPTRSELEDRFLAFARRHGLPEPRINTVISGYEVDVFFPVERVIVELDGWAFHSSRASFHSDRERDAEMLRLDIPTVRITWERLATTPEREAERLHAILARRRARAA